MQAFENREIEAPAVAFSTGRDIISCRVLAAAVRRREGRLGRMVRWVRVERGKHVENVLQKIAVASNEWMLKSRARDNKRNPMKLGTSSEESRKRNEEGNGREGRLYGVWEEGGVYIRSMKVRGKRDERRLY